MHPVTGDKPGYLTKCVILIAGSHLFMPVSVKSGEKDEFTGCYFSLITVILYIYTKLKYI